jgi:hypothetical protein
MQRWEYCHLGQDVDLEGERQDKEIYFWNVLLATIDGPKEIMRSAGWEGAPGAFNVYEATRRDDEQFKKYKNQRIQLVAQLGLAGWEMVGGSSFKRPLPDE